MIKLTDWGLHIKPRSDSVASVLVSHTPLPSGFFCLTRSHGTRGKTITAVVIVTIGNKGPPQMGWLSYFVSMF